MREPRLLLYVALILALTNVLRTVDAAPAMPLVDGGLGHSADFTVCGRVQSPPLLRKPAHNYDYRVQGFNDRGTA